METSLIVLYSVLGVYYFSGILSYLYIYAKNINRNRVYLNATLLKFNRHMETDLDSIIEDESDTEELSIRDTDNREESSSSGGSNQSNDTPDLSYAGY
jgi:hypothetical protein